MLEQNSVDEESKRASERTNERTMNRATKRLRTGESGRESDDGDAMHARVERSADARDAPARAQHRSATSAHTHPVPAKHRIRASRCQTNDRESSRRDTMRRVLRAKRAFVVAVAADPNADNLGRTARTRKRSRIDVNAKQTKAERQNTLSNRRNKRTRCVTRRRRLTQQIVRCCERESAKQNS